MLTIAQDLGVEELRMSCEEHITSTLSILNACNFLAAGMEIQERSSGKYVHIDLGKKRSRDFFSIRCNFPF